MARRNEDTQAESFLQTPGSALASQDSAAGARLPWSSGSPWLLPSKDWIKGQRRLLKMRRKQRKKEERHGGEEGAVGSSGPEAI